MTVVFGIDVGGSGVKGAPVDLEAGSLIASRHRIPTPQPATPESVFEVISDVMAFHGWHGEVGVAIPAVVVDGVARTAANIDPSWVGRDVAAELSERHGGDVFVVNDADAAGLAEVRYGAGKGVDGVVLLLTLGTGIGSALFVDGRLVPNTELGHIEFDGDVAELAVAARLVEHDGLSMDEWAMRLRRYLTMVHRAFFPHRIILGGGISKKFEEFSGMLDIETEVVPAALRNEAGIVGAALADLRRERVTT